MTGKIILLFLALAVIAVSAKPSKPGRIVGGEEATRNEFPSLVQIKRNGAHYCSGHIYTDEWIVTAAHCATGRPADYTIVAGEHDLSAEDGSEQTREVLTVRRHPLYDSATALDFENDIAVMQLFTPFNFNEHVNNDTGLADADFPLPAMATVAGWGLLGEQGSAPNTLQKVNVPIVTDGDCDQAYGGNAVAPSMMCAGEPGKDSCTGDSGGPLLCEDGDDKVVCGLVSWGRGCAREGYPGVYTEVSYFSDWVVGAILPEPEDNTTYVEQLEGCGGAHVGSSGRIGYKLNGEYGSNERCAWSFRAHDRETVRITLQSPIGPGAKLTVTLINYDTGLIDTTITMDNDTPVLRVPGPLVIITFSSEAEATGPGFSFLLQGLGEQDVTRLNYAHHHLGTDTGSFHYPANATQYNDDEVSTVIVNTQTNAVTLSVTQMDLEASGTCSFDVLNLHGHAASNGYTFSQRLCGSSFGSPLTSDGLVLLILRSDYSITRSGYTVAWTS